MRSLICALALLIAVPILAPPASAGDAQSAGILFPNRQPRFKRPFRKSPSPQTPAPEADGNRTAPVDPNAAPKFDAAPADGSAATEAAITPEQKQQVFSAIIAFVSALIGSFAGSGGASPFLQKILEALKGVTGAKAKLRERIKELEAAAKAKV